jgi:tetratricopeptide (TPR) repeat protein/DNA-binding winged helix-turn-helix (wHTH) protein
MMPKPGPVEIIQSKPHECGAIHVDRASRSLTVRGTPQHLRPKTFDLLLYLIEHRDRLVRKEELLDVLWKDTAVTEKSLAQCIIELRKILGDDARNPRYIKTATRLGYQFIGPLGHSTADVVASPGLELEEVTTTRVEIEHLGVRWWIAAAIGAVLAIAGLLAWRDWRSPETALPEIAGKRAVVVMLFENQSRTPDLDWLREGLADMVITNLSRSSKLTVLSRQQLALTLERAGKAEPLRLNDALDIAGRSRAGAMVLGSFARVENRVRIAAQVHDARNGRLLAAESVTADRPEEILARVDMLAAELAADLGAPGPRQPRGDGLAILMTSNLEAYRDYALGLEQAHAFHQKEALDLFQKALALDSDFTMAQARIGYTMSIVGLDDEEGRRYLEQAFRNSRRLTESDRKHIAAWHAIASHDYPDAIARYRDLLASDPAEMESYMSLGRLLRGERQYDEAIEVLKQGLAVNPDAADLLNILGSVYSQLGRHGEAIALEQRYVALAPSEANAYDSLGLAFAWAGRPADAEAALQKALMLKPDFDLALRHLSMLYFQSGRYRDSIHEGERAARIARLGLSKALAYEQLSELLGLMGQPRRAREESEAAKTFEPGFQGVLSVLSSGELRRAARIAASLKATRTDRGARLSSIERVRHYVLGEVALAENRQPEAIGELQESLRYWPLWSQPALFEDSLADAWLRLGRLDEAIAEYRRILELYPGMALARYHLAVAYQRKGQRVAAGEEYRRFRELWSHADPDALQAYTLPTI